MRLPLRLDNPPGPRPAPCAPPARPLPAGVLLAGATGLVGSALMTQCLAAGHAPVHVLLRRPRPLPPGVQPWLVDFGRLPALPASEWALCALGTTLRQAGSREAFAAVDLDAVLAFARAARAAGCRRLGVVSALGADPGSRNFYSRVKGQAEAALRELGFETLVLARPSLLVGDRERLGQPARVGERLALRLSRPVLGWIPAAWRPVAAEQVAAGLLAALERRGPGVHVLASQDLHHRTSSR